MLEKKDTYTARVIFDAFNAVEVTRFTKIYENGVLVSELKPYSYVITAGKDYSDQPAEVQSICQAVHTPEIIAAYQASIEQSEPTA
ncbi:hypothetical protein DN730_08135 [Marinomonas piezotolerans]|uniref:Uncharacterized protein n=1 Tax=Marinomonas piezotolerans TaxID=2213058 RepID=A0A370U9D9_9GAMM|nr:hypothetical protein [Marinomonas piezotolerans]RDL44363.1 hypothetical protein DN730_08135 [Marinomonas piezotolerans]